MNSVRGGGGLESIALAVAHLEGQEGGGLGFPGHQNQGTSSTQVSQVANPVESSSGSKATTSETAVALVADSNHTQRTRSPSPTGSSTASSHHYDRKPSAAVWHRPAPDPEAQHHHQAQQQQQQNHGQPQSKPVLAQAVSESPGSSPSPSPPQHQQQSRLAHHSRWVSGDGQGNMVWFESPHHPHAAAAAAAAALQQHHQLQQHHHLSQHGAAAGPPPAQNAQQQLNDVSSSGSEQDEEEDMIPRQFVSYPPILAPSSQQHYHNHQAEQVQYQQQPPLPPPHPYYNSSMPSHLQHHQQHHHASYASSFPPPPPPYVISTRASPPPASASQLQQQHPHHPHASAWFQPPLHHTSSTSHSSHSMGHPQQQQHPTTGSLPTQDAGHPQQVHIRYIQHHLPEDHHNQIHHPHHMMRRSPVPANVQSSQSHYTIMAQGVALRAFPGPQQQVLSDTLPPPPPPTPLHEQQHHTSATPQAGPPPSPQLQDDHDDDREDTGAQLSNLTNGGGGTDLASSASSSSKKVGVTPEGDLLLDELEVLLRSVAEDSGPPLPPVDGEKPIPPTTELNRNDVLCGRGGETNHHPGNVKYRQLVKACQPAYILAKRRHKPKIATHIVAQVRQLGGRFLKKDTAGVWNDVGNVKAREKTSQALREGAPELRAHNTTGGSASSTGGGSGSGSPKHSNAEPSTATSNSGPSSSPMLMSSKMPDPAQRKRSDDSAASSAWSQSQAAPLPPPSHGNSLSSVPSFAPHPPTQSHYAAHHATALAHHPHHSLSGSLSSSQPPAHASMAPGVVIQYASSSSSHAPFAPAQPAFHQYEPGMMSSTSHQNENGNGSPNTSAIKKRRISAEGTAATSYESNYTSAPDDEHYYMDEDRSQRDVATMTSPPRPGMKGSTVLVVSSSSSSVPSSSSTATATAAGVSMRPDYATSTPLAAYNSDRHPSLIVSPPPLATTTTSSSLSSQHKPFWRSNINNDNCQSTASGTATPHLELQGNGEYEEAPVTESPTHSPNSGSTSSPNSGSSASVGSSSLSSSPVPEALALATGSPAKRGGKKGGGGPRIKLLKRRLECQR